MSNIRNRIGVGLLVLLLSLSVFLVACSKDNNNKNENSEFEAIERITVYMHSGSSITDSTTFRVNENILEPGVGPKTGKLLFKLTSEYLTIKFETDDYDYSRRAYNFYVPNMKEYQVTYLLQSN